MKGELDRPPPDPTTTKWGFSWSVSAWLESSFLQITMALEAELDGARLSPMTTGLAIVPGSTEGLEFCAPRIPIFMKALYGMVSVIHNAYRNSLTKAIVCFVREDCHFDRALWERESNPYEVKQSISAMSSGGQQRSVMGES